MDRMCVCGHLESEHEERGAARPCNHRSQDVHGPEDLGNLHRYGYTWHCTCYDFKDAATHDTCKLCTAVKKRGQSCGCFDNNCQ